MPFDARPDVPASFEVGAFHVRRTAQTTFCIPYNSSSGATLRNQERPHPSLIRASETRRYVGTSQTPNMECLEAYRSQNAYNNGEFILGAERSLIPARSV